MTFPVPDTLIIDGRSYLTSSSPLGNLLTRLGLRFRPIWPTLERGYSATWSISDQILLLTSVTGALDGETARDIRPSEIGIQGNSGGVKAAWFSGTITALAGDFRHLGVPPTRVYEYEARVVIEEGRVLRLSLIDHTPLLNRSNEEIRTTIPPFLWPPHIREPAPLNLPQQNSGD